MSQALRQKGNTGIEGGGDGLSSLPSSHDTTPTAP